MNDNVQRFTEFKSTRAPRFVTEEVGVNTPKTLLRIKAQEDLKQLESIRPEIKSEPFVKDISPKVDEFQSQPTSDKFFDRDVRVTQQFGNRSDVEKFSKGVNYGTDFALPKGTPIALPKGKWEVLESFSGAQKDGFIGDGTNRGYGNSVLVKNLETGEVLRFSHLDKVGVRTGQILGGGLIALSGSTGNSTGPHLDLEYRDPSGRLMDVLQTRYAQFLGNKNG